MRQTRSRKTAPAPLAPSLVRAEVLDVIDDDHVLVRSRRAPTEEVLPAEIAAVGYVPAVGDRVILAPSGEGWLVTGVLGEARRRAHRGLIATVHEGGVELRVAEGDLTLSAPGRIVVRAGEVETAADVVRTTATEVVTRAGRLEIDAGRLVERAGDTYRHVDGLAELQAGRARTLIEGAHQLAAGRTSVTSTEDTVIDGKRVLLG